MNTKTMKDRLQSSKDAGPFRDTQSRYSGLMRENLHRLHHARNLGIWIAERNKQMLVELQCVTGDSKYLPIGDSFFNGVLSLIFLSAI